MGPHSSGWETVKVSFNLFLFQRLDLKPVKSILVSIYPWRKDCESAQQFFWNLSLEKGKLCLGIVICQCPERVQNEIYECEFHCLNEKSFKFCVIPTLIEQVLRGVQQCVLLDIFRFF